MQERDQMETRDTTALVGWGENQDHGQATAGGVAVGTQASMDMRSQMVMAHSFPRDEAAAYKALQRSMQRATLAGKAAYRFERKNNKTGEIVEITGASVHLAREAARLWGNLQYGFTVVEDADPERMNVIGFAFDAQTNTRVQTAIRVRRTILRKGRWIEPDERDAREMTNRHGALAERNAITKLLPPDLIDDALTAARQTREIIAGNDLGKSRKETVARMIAAFGAIGVDRRTLETRLGKSVDIIDQAELTSLRDLHKAISDGEVTVEEAFGAEGSSSEAQVGERTVVATSTATQEPRRTVRAREVKTATKEATVVVEPEPEPEPEPKPEPKPEAPELQAAMARVQDIQELTQLVREGRTNAEQLRQAVVGVYKVAGVNRLTIAQIRELIAYVRDGQLQDLLSAAKEGGQ